MAKRGKGGRVRSMSTSGVMDMEEGARVFGKEIFVTGSDQNDGMWAAQAWRPQTGSGHNKSNNISFSANTKVNFEKDKTFQDYAWTIQASTETVHGVTGLIIVKP